MDCEFCSGERGCPRASAGSIRCSASKCKDAQRKRRRAGDEPIPEVMLPTVGLEAAPAAPRFCYNIKEVIGVSFCMEKMSGAELRAGREFADDELKYQVRGKFGDHDDEDLDDMMPDTRWVKLSDLVDKIDEKGCAALDSFAKDLQKVAKAARRRLREAE